MVSQDEFLIQALRVFRQKNNVSKSGTLHLVHTIHVVVSDGAANLCYQFGDEGCQRGGDLGREEFMLVEIPTPIGNI